MSKQKKPKKELFLFALQIFSFACVAFSFLLIPIEFEKEIRGIPLTSFIAGVVFWGALVLASLIQIILVICRNKFFKKHNLKRNKKLRNMGVFSFFKNKIAVVMDILFIMSIIGLALVFALTESQGYICYIFVAIFVFLLFMHSVFNGKIYFYICALVKTFYISKKKQRKEERVEKNG